jgi:hypothetical protein
MIIGSLRALDFDPFLSTDRMHIALLNLPLENLSAKLFAVLESLDSCLNLEPRREFSKCHSHVSNGFYCPFSLTKPLDGFGGALQTSG